MHLVVIGESFEARQAGAETKMGSKARQLEPKLVGANVTGPSTQQPIFLDTFHRQ
jgi:hypothetical protein